MVDRTIEGTPCAAQIWVAQRAVNDCIHRSTGTLIPRYMTQGPVPRHSDTSAYTLYHMVLGATPAIILHTLQQRYISLILLFLFKYA